MSASLSDIRLSYVLEHLSHHADISGISGHFVYGSQKSLRQPGIRFLASEEELDTDSIPEVKGLPVLFPVERDKTVFYSETEDGLVFHHDLLKSSFYLLSGYQEFVSKERDQFGRFPYKGSIQEKLGIIQKPLVNYYFGIILDALEDFANKQDLPFSRRKSPEHPVLMLSHDIDRIDAYSFFESGYRVKQLLGLAPSPYKLAGKLREAAESVYYFLNPFIRKDPFWSFEKLMQWEAERNIRASYYFLEKSGGRHLNSRYHFHEKRFAKLFRDLSAAGHEVGLHGTIESANSQKHMDRTMSNLAQVSPDPVVGIRQHYLKYTPGKTALIQEEAGLKYDTSLGFAEHDGFRNSYCWPFRKFDFTGERIMDLWEIPLTVMEGTHFYYRNLDLPEGRNSIENLLLEVKKFKGVFSLLWHNHFFDEREYPGITAHYTGILDHFSKHGFEGITGKEIWERMQDSAT